MFEPARPVRALPSPPHHQESALETHENHENEGSDLRAFLALFRRHAVLIAVVTILTGVIAYVVTSQQTAQYTSTSSLLYTEPATAPQGFDPARYVSTLVGVGTSSSVLDTVAQAHNMTPAQLRKALSITGNPDADLINVSATSGSATEAAALAEDVAQGMIDYTTTQTKNALRLQIVSDATGLRQYAGKSDPASVAAATTLRTDLAQAKAELSSVTSPLTILTPATVPSSPSSPHPARDAGIALLAGLVLALMLAAVRDRLDRRIREIEDIEAVYHAPTLGVVPFASARKKLSRSSQVADFSGAAALADAYRTIRTNLTLMETQHDGPSVIVVTSAIAGEGKSAVTANLAQSLSVTGRRVLAISADLHNPALHKYFPGGYQEGDLFDTAAAADPLRERTLDDPTLNAYFATGYGEDGTEAEPKPDSRRRRRATGLGEKWTGPTRPQGLVPVLAGEVPLDKAVYVIPLSAQERERGGSLHLLADGGTFFDPAALLSSDAMRQLFKEASQSYDAIVVDTPPVLANADATLLAQGANILVLVARLDHLTRNQARRAYRAMTSMRLAPSGIIVTGEVEDGAYGYGYRSNQPLEYDRGLAGDTPQRRASTSTGSS